MEELQRGDIILLKFKDDRKEVTHMARLRIKKGLHYITHINNVHSILKYGILSHERVEAENIQFTPIYDAKIVANRRKRQIPDGRNLWSFANLYYQPRNAMLYRVVFFGGFASVNDIVILGVRDDILNRSDIFISTGNAASPYSDILPAHEGRSVISKIRRSADKDWWKVEDGSKREMMAECLVPDSVLPDYIHTIYVASHDVANRLKLTVASSIPIIPEASMFFQPLRKIDLTSNLSIVEGDMFFSRMHTLTVSVNCVGIMGKGLASRAKYQFPDVYVFYQDLCRKRIIKMGKPYLYKRESSFDYQLADEPETLLNANSETWFLLFPTKQHWRERADIHGIEEGLKWLRDNYKEEGVKSLSIPALGCGLGWLQWSEVGPLLCKYLVTFDIPVWVYLPAEKKVPDNELSNDFLLK